MGSTGSGKGEGATGPVGSLGTVGSVCKKRALRWVIGPPQEGDGEDTPVYAIKG